MKITPGVFKDALGVANIDPSTTLEYRFSTQISTDATNPRIGRVMANNATANAATKLFISPSGS